MSSGNADDRGRVETYIRFQGSPDLRFVEGEILISVWNWLILCHYGCSASLVASDAKMLGLYI